jgi:hypothetical protein
MIMCHRDLKNDTVSAVVKRPVSVFYFESEETGKNPAPHAAQWGITGIGRDVGRMLPYTGLQFFVTIPQLTGILKLKLFLNLGMYP